MERKEIFHVNDALNTFYLWLNGKRHMVKDQPLPPDGILFPISSKGSSHRQDNTYHSLCYTSCGALAWTKIWYGVWYDFKLKN